MSRSAKARIRAATLLTLGVAVAAAGLAPLAPPAATASSHREAPRISGFPQYDNTDLWMFVSPDKPDTTTIIGNWIPLELAAGGPTFYPWATDARYDFNIDNDGDSKANITLRYTFSNSYQNRDTFLYATDKVTSLDDPDLNFRETYKLELINRDTGTTKVLTSNGRVAPSNIGKGSMPNYQTLRDQAVTSLAGGIKSFAGQSEDAFFLDLRIFDLLYGGDLTEVGDDSVAEFNSNTLALQIPTKLLTSGTDPVIGAWTDTSRSNASGGWTQLSRLGMPLVNEVVIPVRDKDRFNASQPSGDAQFLKYVTDPEVPRLVQKLYKIPAPATPRNDLVSVFLTGVKGLNQPAKVTPSEQLRLNTSTKPAAKPNRLGVIGKDNAGFPNGRRLADDVLDITLQVAEGELVGSPNDLGDAVDRNDVDFGRSFPYVALPTPGSKARGVAGGGSGGSAKPGSMSGSGQSGAASGTTMLTGGRGGAGGSEAIDAAVPASSSGSAPGGPLLPAGIVALGVLALIGGATMLRRHCATAA